MRAFAALVLTVGVLSIHAAAVAGAVSEPTTRLVFAAAVAYDHGSSETQIYSVDPAGRRAAQLTFGTEPASTPRPSPDGRRIAFERGGSIWVMRQDGRGQRLLAAHGAEPAWTPDARRVAYVNTDAQGNHLGIRVVAVDGTGSRTLVGGAVDGPAWSPDGRSLAFVREGALVVLRDGRQRAIITDPSIRSGRIGWSFDGRWLTLESGKLEVVGADGKRRREVTGGMPAWSPNRSLLVYATFGLGSVNLLNPVSGTVRELTRADYVNSLAWSPRDDAIAFTEATLFTGGGGVSALEVARLAGNVRVLDRGPLPAFPLPDGVTWTTPPPGLRYRPPMQVGPLVAGEELRLREPVDALAADGDRVAYRFCGTIGAGRRERRLTSRREAALPSVRRSLLRPRARR